VLIKDELENVDYGWIGWSLLMSMHMTGWRWDSHWEDSGEVDNRAGCI
jgi:hypothetical protein